MLQGKEILRMGSGAVRASSTTLNECQLFLEVFYLNSPWCRTALFYCNRAGGLWGSQTLLAWGCWLGRGTFWLWRDRPIILTASVSGAVLLSKLFHPKAAVVLLQSQKKRIPAENQPRKHRIRAGTWGIVSLFLPSPCQQWIVRGNYLGFELYCIGKEKRIGKRKKGTVKSSSNFKEATILFHCVPFSLLSPGFCIKLPPSGRY